ncbi:hypothetical protein ACHAXT_002027 [Thalassiosira profunda]
MRISGQLLLAAALAASASAAGDGPSRGRRLYGGDAKDGKNHFVFHRNKPAGGNSEKKDEGAKGREAYKPRNGSGGPKKKKKGGKKKGGAGGGADRNNGGGGGWRGTRKPTRKPTGGGGWKPSRRPTGKPTAKPVWSTAKPTAKPTAEPTSKPTAKPTVWSGSTSSDSWDSPTQSPEWAGSSASGDAWNGPTSPDDDKCQSYERGVCCDQDLDYSYEDRKDVCERVGCNIAKCGKRASSGDGDAWDAPTMSPAWHGGAHSSSGDAPSSSEWSGDAHNDGWEKCTQADRDACCDPDRDWTYSQRKGVCDYLGCNLKKCGKRDDTWDEWNHGDTTTAWSGDAHPVLGAWSGDDHDEEKCTQDDRDECCDQDADRSYVDRKEVCDDLGCNLAKCGKRSDGAKPTSWDGDSWDSPTMSPEWSGSSSKDAWGAPTLSPEWSGDAHSSSEWSGDDHDKCTQDDRDVCCNQPAKYSYVDRKEICDDLGCNLAKCGKRDDGSKPTSWDGDSWDSPTMSPEWSGSSSKDAWGAPTLSPEWSGDAHDSSVWSGDDHDKCTQDDRDECCDQPSSRSYADRKEVCDDLGCNLAKCGTRNGAKPTSWDGDSWDAPTMSPEWNGDAHSSSEWSGDEHPTRDPTLAPHEWSGDSWSGDAHGDDKCTNDDRDACCDQDKDKSFAKRREVCDELGCNILKCGKRDGDDKPTSKPTKKPTKKPSGGDQVGTIRSETDCDAKYSGGKCMKKECTIDCKYYKDGELEEEKTITKDVDCGVTINTRQARNLCDEYIDDE